MTMSEESTPASSPRIYPELSRASTPGTDEDTLFDYSSDNDQYVLVTGGLGFIGSHTVLELLKSGHNVVVVDDLSNSHRDVFSRILKAANLYYGGLDRACPKAILHNVDYRDEPAMRSILDSFVLSPTITASSPTKASSIVGVIHFAAFKAVEESINHPLKYYKNNISGLIDFITLLDEYSIKTFIFSSSAAVYGNLADGSRRLREEHCVHEPSSYVDVDGIEKPAQPGYTGITSPYGRTKYFGEAILSDIATSDPSWTIVGLRYFNPIGCDASGLLGEDPKGVPSNLLPVVVKVMTGQLPALAVYGNNWSTPDGTAIRDFIHVSDLARGHTAALFAARARRIDHGFRTFNLGTGTGYSIMEVVEAMKSVSGRRIPTQIAERRAGDVQASIAAADRARRELGWSTKESLLGACRDTCNYLSIWGKMGTAPS